MDPTRFDALARTLFVATTRRGAVGLLLGARFFGFDREALAKNTKRTSRKGNSRAQRRRKGKGDGEPTRRNAKDRNARPAGAEATQCCSTGNCAPGPGKNLQKCCYQGHNLSGKNFKGANLGSADFARATLTGANVQGANLGKACFVDAVLTSLRTNASTNWGGAVFCRTQTDAGEDDSGCGRGTPCCPTCDARHPCNTGEDCCNGRCIRGNCCDNGQQSTCGDDEICCNNQCADGECCQVAECPNETCQRRACEANRCTYAPVFGEPGPRCQTICCRNEAGEPACCDAGVQICLPSGRCGCGRDADCGTDEKCCAGICIARSRCCEGANPAGCGGDLNCCVIAGNGVCRECCDDGHCSPGQTCQGGSCQRMATTFERVRAVVAALFDVDEAAITMETEFVRDLNADSLDMVEIILAVEEEFDLVITDEELEELEIRTVGDVVRAIDEIRG